MDYKTIKRMARERCVSITDLCALAPKNDPCIAISVYVENGGFGNIWAAPIAGLMAEKYLTDTIKRPHMEEYVLRGIRFDQQ